MADDTVNEGKIVTFYSFKGGTGRTMALANVAWILASNGLKVLVVDWDLDSPGLHRYFHPFLAPAKVAATPGIIELITEYTWDATEVAEPSADWIRDYAQILPHAISVNWPFPDDGTLDFVSAGRQNRDYSSAATTVDWDNFYDRLDGGQFIDALRADMKAHYDYTLIDSRTGLSDIADICTVHLPDILVNCFALNDQSIDGAAEVAKGLGQRYHYRNIQVLPVPMRIDEAEKDKADVGLAAAKARFGGLRARLTAYDESDYWAAVSIPYKPFYAFEETLAVFGDAPRSPLSLLGAYERMTVAITDGRVRAAGAMAEETRLQYKAAFRRRRQQTGDIYLSYVPEDRMWADWIAAVLVPRGIRVVRPAASAAGRNTREDAERGAAAASRTIAVLSGAYMQSPQAKGVWDAMGAADPTGTSRRLIPVRVGETRLEPPFSERTVVDLTRRDANQATEELLKALGYPPNLADAVEAAPSAEPRYPRTIPSVWRVPTRNASFTGRNEVLEKLHDGLIGTSTAVVLPVALHGLGGVGKTQVAQEYAHRFMADYDLVWWVPSEQRDLINPSLADLAAHLGVRPADSTAETAEAVREALRRGRPYDRWLLIFDNADEPGEVEDFFPGGPGHVIVTSRNPAWSKLAEPVAVDVFSRRESLDYLQRRVQSLSVDDATLVARELGDLPLAIEQAGAWLAATGMDATEYVAQIRERFAATMELGRPANYPTSVAVTYQLSFERLKSQSPAAARLLELCACFAPDPISLTLLSSDEMVKSLTPYDKRLRAARTVLGLLITDITRFSLAKVDRDMTSNSIQVHRLVQAAIRDQMQPASYHDEAVHEVHKVLAGARPRQGDTDDPVNWARYDLIWPHLGPSEVWNCDDEEARQLLIDRVRYLWKRGDYEEALEVANKLEAQWQQKIGPDDEQTLSLRFHIANVLRSQGKFEAAHALDTEIFARQQESLGGSHPSTLLTAGSLGGDLRGLGRFREALALDESTYSSNKDLLGPDDPNTLSSANNLAVDLRLVGDCFRARDLDRETRNYRQVVLGPVHPYTLHSASMLARDMREAGDYAGSVDLLEETYVRYREVLGEAFVDTLRTGKSLAVSLRKVGRLDDAYVLTKEIDGRYQRSHESSHPDSLACKLNLACDLSARGEKHAAVEVASRVLESYQSIFGGRHPFTLVAENNISTYLRGVGTVRQALALLDRTLDAMRDSLDEDHPFTLSCQINKANCLHDLRRMSEAESLQRDTLERLKKTLGANHPDTQVCEANLAIVLRAQGRADEAEALQLTVISGLTDALGHYHPSVAALREWRLQNRDLEAQPT
jgi:tetratricopeptide (TPR) repeat protein